MGQEATTTPQKSPAPPAGVTREALKTAGSSYPIACKLPPRTAAIIALPERANETPSDNERSDNERIAENLNKIEVEKAAKYKERLELLLVHVLELGSNKNNAGQKDEKYTCEDSLTLLFNKLFDEKSESERPEKMYSAIAKLKKVFNQHTTEEGSEAGVQPLGKMAIEKFIMNKEAITAIHIPLREIVTSKMNLLKAESDAKLAEVELNSQHPDYLVALGKITAVANKWRDYAIAADSYGLF